MYSFSVKAEKDLELLYDYSATQFGDEQAEIYLLDLENAFLQLSEFPYLGKSVENIRPNLRCYYYRSHAIYYKVIKSDIFIVRVLDQRMDHRRILQ